MTNLMMITMAVLLYSIQNILTLEEGSADANIESFETQLNLVKNQIMLQQFYAEQRVRSDGQSGIHTLRQRHGGTKNYFSQTHTGSGAASMHNHGNNIRTVGLGEFSAVLNGVEFRTRHNDYRLFMPSKDSKEYNARTPIPFPEIPPAVLEKTNIDDQIDEMKEWFKAWRDQDYTVRDYRKYFKPILCYLEGAWTKAEDKIDEPFLSDRHFIDAATWNELNQKIMFNAYSGSKNTKENLGYLPTKIIEIVNNSIPVFAQWNYRILCHPLKKDLSTHKLRLVEDLSVRMMKDMNILKFKNSREARFEVISEELTKFQDSPTKKEDLLDELMAEIPGKDNYQGRLFDSDTEGSVLSEDGQSDKDVSRYHRWFRLSSKDAFGLTNAHRGFNDPSFFAAMTTQEKVAGMKVEKCQKVEGQKRKMCSQVEQKWTYAIPLEIIYLTPLQSWNPYNLAYHGEFERNDKSNPVIANKRRGNCDIKGQEFNGTSSKFYYITPAEFYIAREKRGSADTTKRGVCALDQNGKSHKVNAAGIQIFLENIADVGVLRQRYPIFPVHSEGSSTWKELNALREIVLSMQMPEIKHQNNTVYRMSMSKGTPEVSPHFHTVSLSGYEMEQCLIGKIITKMTSTERAHSHQLQIKCREDTVWYIMCGTAKFCADGHRKKLYLEESF